MNEPLQWILLTDEPIEDAAAPRRRVGYYEKRPKVEAYHKAQEPDGGDKPRRSPERCPPGTQ